jgi:hypothetical protein
MQTDERRDLGPRAVALGKSVLPYLSASLVTGVYAIIFYLASRLDLGSLSSGVMSLAFIFSLPLAVGMFAVAVAPRGRRDSVKYLVFVPWISTVIMLWFAAVWAREAIICAVLLLPVFLPLVTVGAVLGLLLTKSLGEGLERQNPLLLVALLPFLISPLEAQFKAPDSEHVVHNSVIVHASPEAVWRQIIRVPEIRPDEQQFSPLYWLGLPRPVEATLSREGVGAVRHASFEGGLLFIETVDEWRDRQSIGFSIHRDEGSVPPEPLGAIGGPAFDVLRGRYEIQPIGDGRVILHLSSVHRLTTRFNWYAGRWTEPIMSELQRSILAIVKDRAEAFPT